MELFLLNCVHTVAYIFGLVSSLRTSKGAFLWLAHGRFEVTNATGALRVYRREIARFSAVSKIIYLCIKSNVALNEDRFPKLRREVFPLVIFDWVV